MTVRITSRRWTKADGSVGQVMMADIRVPLPDGTHHRERPNVPKEITGRTGAKRWAETRARYLTGNGLPVEEGPPTPTLHAFGERWMEEYSRANGNKPSTIDAKERILRLHLYPVLGGAPLDHIREPEIQRLKLSLSGLRSKTQACVLSVLATILRTAERWEEIVKAPHIALPRIPDPGVSFYDFEEWEALVDGARRAGPMVLCAVLLGGEAGLRRGELVALERADVSRVSVRVVRNEWEGHTGTPRAAKPAPSRSPYASRKPSRKSATSAASASSGKPTGSRSASRR
jgi:integrase